MARVLVVTNMYPPHHLGGYELSCADVVDRWRERGHEVSVLTSTMRLPGVDTPPSPSVWRDLTFYWDDHELVTPTVWRRFRRERANQRAMQRALDNAQPDVVSVWHMGAVNLALLSCAQRRGIPVVLNLLDPWLVYERELDAWTRLWRDRPGAGRAVQLLTGVHTAVPDLSDALHCFCSEFVREQCRNEPVWPCHRSELTPLGIDRRDFPPVSGFRRRLAWRLLYVGRIERRKGMATLIRALPLLPSEATVRFVGRGDVTYRAELNELATELGVIDRITFEALPRAELAGAYADADALVFPSEWDEPFGLVPIEAMACGTPVVATGVGGSREFLTDGDNCVLFAKADPAALAASLSRLADDEGLRRRIVAGGLATAELLTADRQADLLEKLHLGEIA